jgi:hypothetical protein
MIVNRLEERDKTLNSHRPGGRSGRYTSKSLPEPRGMLSGVDIQELVAQRRERIARPKSPPCLFPCRDHVMRTKQLHTLFFSLHRRPYSFTD